MFHGIGEHGLGMGWGWILGIIILAILIWFMANGFKQGPKNSKDPLRNPLEILKERYARGEISDAEFEEKKKGLEDR